MKMKATKLVVIRETSHLWKHASHWLWLLLWIHCSKASIKYNATDWKDLLNVATITTVLNCKSNFTISPWTGLFATDFSVYFGWNLHMYSHSGWSHSILQGLLLMSSNTASLRVRVRYCGKVQLLHLLPQHCHSDVIISEVCPMQLPLFNPCVTGQPGWSAPPPSYCPHSSRWRCMVCTSQTTDNCLTRRTWTIQHIPPLLRSQWTDWRNCPCDRSPTVCRATCRDHSLTNKSTGQSKTSHFSHTLYKIYNPLALVL